jgi:hypothetical protein
MSSRMRPPELSRGRSLPPDLRERGRDEELCSGLLRTDCGSSSDRSGQERETPKIAALLPSMPHRSPRSQYARHDRLTQRVLAPLDELNPVAVRVLDETQSRPALADGVRRTLRLDALSRQRREGRV